MLYEDIQMSGSLDVTGSFVVPIGTTASAGEYTGSLVYDSTDKKLYVWSGSWGIVGTQSNPESAPNTVFTDIPANLTASVSIGTNLISMSLTEADDLESTPYSASISGSSFEIVFSNADSSSGFIRNTTTLAEGTYYYNVTVFDSGSINSQSYNNQTVIVAVEPPLEIDYLVVAGGGGAGSNYGGGSGAGGLRTSYGVTSGGGSSAESSITLTSGQTYTVTVGSGGTGAPNGTNQAGNNGSDSSFSGAGITTITSIGGGRGYRGGSSSQEGSSGGSGGGWAATSGTGAAGTSGQGFKGGNGVGTNTGTGGGGGAAGVGVNSYGGYRSGEGGPGLEVNITGGTGNYYAGGGGGGTYFWNTPVSGGVGGGGTGGVYSTGNTITNQATNGTANTGGGGGGGAAGGGQGGNGGSGVVILRISTSLYSGTTTGSPTVTTDGSDTIIKFTASGTYTA